MRVINYEKVILQQQGLYFFSAFLYFMYCLFFLPCIGAGYAQKESYGTRLPSMEYYGNASSVCQRRLGELSRDL